MNKYHLFRWKVVSKDDSPYIAPEQRVVYLWGFRDQDEYPVHTTRIVSVNGREVTTKSGSIYILEDIDPDYLAWMIKNNIDWDDQNPIKIKG